MSDTTEQLSLLSLPMIESLVDSVESHLLHPVVKPPGLAETAWSSSCPFSVLLGPCLVTHSQPIALFLDVAQTLRHYAILSFRDSQI